jgi:hypothetical protein
LKVPKKGESMSSENSPNIISQKMTVKDPQGLMWILGAMLLFAFLTYLFLFGMDETSILGALVFGLIPLGISVVMFKAQNEGYVIDPENDSFTYPGGKAADEITDYIKPSWILQKFGLKREYIQLSSITRISQEDITTQQWNKTLKAYQTINVHNITFEGTFGSIKNSFSSRGKRDQLYALLTQTLRMGDPVVVR